MERIPYPDRNLLAGVTEAGDFKDIRRRGHQAELTGLVGYAGVVRSDDENGSSDDRISVRVNDRSLYLSLLGMEPQGSGHKQGKQQENEFQQALLAWIILVHLLMFLVTF